MPARANSPRRFAAIAATLVLVGCAADDSVAPTGDAALDASDVGTDVEASADASADAAAPDATMDVDAAIDAAEPVTIDPDAWLSAALARGPYDVAERELEFVDTSRGTPPRGDNAATDNRILLTTVWFPENPTEPMPVVLWAHGKGSGRLDNDTTASLLASWGYLVAAPDFPGTTRNIPGDDALGDIANQPLDLSFILDTLLAHTPTEDTPWGGGLDAEHVVVGGVSLGAMTALASTWIPEFKDPRFDAVIALAPPGCYLPRPRWAGDAVPMLAMFGTADALLRYSSQGDIPFADAPADTSVLVTLNEGSHLGFGDIARLLEGLDHPDSLGCDTTDGQLNNSVLGPLSESLGGPDAATVELECQVPCVGDEASGVSMRPSRQGQLSRAAVLTFVRSVVEGERSLQELRDAMAAQPDAFIR